MGRDKALLELAGRPIIGYVAAVLDAAGCEVVAVGRTDDPFAIRSIADAEPGRGPAAGLLAALRFGSGAAVVLVAADQPFLRHRTVEELLAIDAVAVVPTAEGIRQATCAVYRPAALPALERLLGGGSAPSLQDLLDELETCEVAEHRWREWGEDGRSWISLDTPEDLQRAISQIDAGDRIPEGL